MTKIAYRYSDVQIIIFARKPVAGQVKTRLIPSLGEQGATQLYSALLQFTIKNISAYHLAPVCMAITPESDIRYFSVQNGFPDMEISPQKGMDLGERMYHALESSLQRYSKAILIGTDCPFFTRQDFQNAIDTLDDKDMVFSPARDGGYVLVGAKSLFPGSFNNILWGTERVMQQTRQTLTGLNISWQELRQLQDIDTPEDLKYLSEIHELANSSFHITDIINRDS